MSASLDMLELLDEFEPGSRARVWARVPEAIRDFAEAQSRIGWVPLEHGPFLSEAIVAEFGRQRSRELYRRAIPALIEKPLLEPLVMGMLRVLGKRRTRLLAIIPKGWGLVFRDLCEPRVGSSGPGEIEVIFDAIAPEVREHPGYFEMWAGVCLGLLDLACPDGTLDYEVAADWSSIRARFTW
ncbi:MAG: hypothetical protein GY723_19715 [bacterium]|nr:hypothetical protein [bacterium]